MSMPEIEYHERLEQARELDLSLSDEALRLYSDVMGFDVTVPATTDQIERSQNWIHGPQKRMFEWSLCQLFGYLGGRAVCQLGEAGIRRHDGHEGTVSIDVGFLGTEGPIMEPIIKIRTMVPDAEGLRPETFEHTSFVADKGREDSRVLPSRLAKALRRTGLDELEQVVYQVPAGEMAVVGARAYTRPEIEGTAALIEFARSSDLEVSDRAKELLETYTDKVDQYAPKKSLIGLFQATTAKHTPHLTRMLGDIIVWERSTPATDLRIAMHAFKQRARGVGAW